MRTKKINYNVNSVSFGSTIFHTIHTKNYLFWFSKCGSNVKQQILDVAYITYMCIVNVLENI
jgi:hypothetical protein